ncbi:unnamed protein product [Parnassius mnemosyne]|uniref:Glucosylceramidase n=1 Tax=Parnassius mnemosyne TaxID=213953 RepID=A0AAV1L5G3_9NEOP
MPNGTFLYQFDVLSGKGATELTEDVQCAARDIRGKSVVCVCNDTYCDTITRDIPAKGSYISYTSSEGGSRFKKRSGKLQCNVSKNCKYSLELYPDTKYQTIEGFGTAVTGTAGYNLRSLPRAAQENLIKSYFSDEGLEYNMLRVPIGGSDFSLSEFAYNELPIDDFNLTNYTLSREDYHYKLPTIKRMMDVSKSPVHVIASTWSPPKWMKYYTEHNPTCGYLKNEFYQTYADYHLKFLEEYAAEGVPVWGITTTNEPTMAFTNLPAKSCIGFTAKQMGKFIAENLGPTIRNSTFKDTKILALDDQRYTISSDFYDIINNYPEVLDYIDGIALHFYYDTSTPVQVLKNLQRRYPELFVIATEACRGNLPNEKVVDLGSWERAEAYIKDIIQDLNNNVIGWMDWNFCLDKNGGPNWTGGHVDSPIIVDAKKGEFLKQPMFYAMGHFSKFIPRGSRRIRVEQKRSSKYIDEVAFLTPQNTVVLLIYNDSVNDATVGVKINNREAAVKLEAKSITTVEFNIEECNGNSNTSLTLRVKGNPVILKLKLGSIEICV